MGPSMRILFAGHDFKFLTPLLARLDAGELWSVALHQHQGHVVRDVGLALEQLGSADVIFCEWALGNLEWFSHRKHPGQTLVARLHHHELTLPFLDRVAWDAVDALIFIAPNNLKRFVERRPHLSTKCHLIYNFIDTEDLYRPKRADAMFTLGLMGTSPMRKAPHVAVEILKGLREQDTRYMLRIKGKHPWEYDWVWARADERIYYERLYEELEGFETGVVTFDPHGQDVPEWFQNVGFVLSTSDHEGSHQSVAEGMASGSVPIIRNWQGAAELYPSQHVFGDVREAISRIRSLTSAPARWATTARNCAAFAHSRFDIAVVLPLLERLIEHAVTASREHDRDAATHGSGQDQSARFAG